TDVNECASPDTNGCDRNALCTNIEGSYICRCLKGYQGNGRFCADVDECANVETNECDSNALCTNTEGSYVCRCFKGYEGDGRNCTGTGNKFSCF
ncbi:unnamed protein product, partial [Pocillopora meandrina]